MRHRSLDQQQHRERKANSPENHSLNEREILPNCRQYDAESAHTRTHCGTNSANSNDRNASLVPEHPVDRASSAGLRYRPHERPLRGRLQCGYQVIRMGRQAAKPCGRRGCPLVWFWARKPFLDIAWQPHSQAWLSARRVTFPKSSPRHNGSAAFSDERLIRISRIARFVTLPRRDVLG